MIKELAKISNDDSLQRVMKSTELKANSLSEIPKNKVQPQSSASLSKKNHTLFFNRELSWLQFNYRVLEESSRKDNPLLERLKFLAIFESNLIEFFMIRVSGLKQIKASSISEIQLDGKTPLDTLYWISRCVNRHLNELSRNVDDIWKLLQETGIYILKNQHELLPHEKKFVSSYFHSELFRVLTPLAIDPSHPFPHIVNRRLNLVILLSRQTEKNQKEDIYAVMEVPGVLPRFVKLPQKKTKQSPLTYRFIPLEAIIKMHLKDFFPGTKIQSVHTFMIIRNSDLSIDEVASDNLLSTIEDEIKNRRWGETVCLHYSDDTPEQVRNFLTKELDLEEYEAYRRSGILNMQDLWQLYTELSNSEISREMKLCDPPFIPHHQLHLDTPTDIFSAIRKKDILLHHPYDSFKIITKLLDLAAKDPKILAIKQTLYRTGKDSPIVQSLIEAAENGKQVTALVELKARFDEARNINWAKEMEHHGIHVVYGLVGLKIHGKMLQIIRREKDGVRTYVHLSTGNYNPITAKIYTDMSLLTCEPKINYDIMNLFHSLTGIATLPHSKKASTAPLHMRKTLLRLIQREIHHAENNKPAVIRLKMNSLSDPDMILRLYRASRAGVKIQLNIRGICCLRPGIRGVSDNIEVVSVVGRFLEHSRIFYFENGGKPRVFLSSADLMERNLNRRIEILFPIEDADHVQKLISILDAIFQDNHNLRRLQSDGNYKRIKPEAHEARFSSQRYFRDLANKETEKHKKEEKTRRQSVFQPLSNPELSSKLQEKKEREE